MDLNKVRMFRIHPIIVSKLVQTAKVASVALNIITRSLETSVMEGASWLIDIDNATSFLTGLLTVHNAFNSLNRTTNWFTNIADFSDNPENIQQ